MHITGLRNISVSRALKVEFYYKACLPVQSYHCEMWGRGRRIQQGTKYLISNTFEYEDQEPKLPANLYRMQHLPQSQEIIPHSSVACISFLINFDDILFIHNGCILSSFQFLFIKSHLISIHHTHIYSYICHTCPWSALQKRNAIKEICKVTWAEWSQLFLANPLLVPQSSWLVIGVAKSPTGINRASGRNPDHGHPYGLWGNKAWRWQRNS